MKLTGRLRKALLLLAGLTIAIVCYAQLVAPYAFQSRTDRLLARYSEHPSDETASRLMRLLDEQAVSPEQGTRILKALLTPQIATRKSYRVGHPVWFSLNRPFPVHFRHMSVEDRETVSSNDGSNSRSSYRSGGNCAGTGSRHVSLHHTPSSVGIYQMTVSYEYRLTPCLESTSWQWPSPAPFPWNLIPMRCTSIRGDKGGQPVYACEFSIPVTLNVVAAEEAEAVTVVSNPALDLEMQQAFTAQPSAVHCSYTAKSGAERESHGGIEVCHSALPVDVAFSASFVDANGKVSPLTEPDGAVYCVQRGAPGRLQLPMLAIGLEELGAHNGVIVLSPSVEAAYVDPGIREIWGGTLQFPVTITVKDGRR